MDRSETVPDLSWVVIKKMFPQKATIVTVYSYIHQTSFADDALNMIKIHAIVLENNAQKSYIYIYVYIYIYIDTYVDIDQIFNSLKQISGHMEIQWMVVKSCPKGMVPATISWALVLFHLYGSCDLNAEHSTSGFGETWWNNAYG